MDYWYHVDYVYFWFLDLSWTCWFLDMVWVVFLRLFEEARLLSCYLLFMVSYGDIFVLSKYVIHYFLIMLLVFGYGLGLFFYIH